MFGSLIGGAIGLLGNKLAGDAQESREDHQRAWQHDWNQKQYDFAMRQQTQGIQDRVADARKAGISPLAAMGMQGASMPNINTSGQSDSARYTARGAEAVGNAFQSLALRKEKAETRKAEVEARDAARASDRAWDAQKHRDRMALETVRNATSRYRWSREHNLRLDQFESNQQLQRARLQLGRDRLAQEARLAAVREIPPEGLGTAAHPYRTHAVYQTPTGDRHTALDHRVQMGIEELIGTGALHNVYGPAMRNDNLGVWLWDLLNNPAVGRRGPDYRNYVERR